MTDLDNIYNRKQNRLNHVGCLLTLYQKFIP
jgi:hypothetical protein